MKNKKLISSFIYLEWMVPIIKYFKITNKSEKVYELCIPFLISIICVGIYNSHSLIDTALTEFYTIIPNLISIFIGFVISAGSIILGGSEKNNMSLTTVSRDKNQVTMYTLLFTNIIYMLTIQVLYLGIFLVVSFLRPLFVHVNISWLFLLILTFLLLHILFLLLRVIQLIYLSYFKK